MNGKILMFILTEITAPMAAQKVPVYLQDLEDLHYMDESAVIPEPVTGDDPESLTLSLDLNTATAEELEASGIFTSYQIYQLLNYRERFGPLYSIHELPALPGFNSSAVKRFESLVSFSQNTLPVRKKVQHMVLFNMERSYPASGSGSDFTGPLLKSSFRIKIRPRANLSMALSYEKDAGETFFYRRRPQFLSGHISIEGSGFMRQLVLGNFQLNQGLGLVNGAGFFHNGGDLRITGQSVSRIRASASLSENIQERGMACKMGTNKFRFLLWSSYQNIALSPSVINEHMETDRWLDFRRRSGLYRTTGELEGRDLAYRIHTGIQFIYRNRGLCLGALSGQEWVGPGKKARKHLESIPEVSLQQKMSLHGNWYREKIQVFGELAGNQNRSLAFLLGSSYQFNDFVRGSLLVHHYGKEYRGSLPSAYSSGSHIYNEQGLAFHLKMESGRAVLIDLGLELFRYPAPRYQAGVPSEACRLDISLQNSPDNMLQWRARVVSKSWQTTPANERLPHRPLLDSRVDRIDGQLIYRHEERFRWLSRLVVGYCTHNRKFSTAYAALQQFTYRSESIRITAQLVLFQVSEWANRIYLYEPGFYYSFNFPVYYGSGHKTTLLLRLMPLRGLTVSALLSGTQNRGKFSWNSGIQLLLKI